MEKVEEIVRRNAERFNMIVIELSVENGKIEAILYRRTKGITVNDLEELTYLIQKELKPLGLDTVYDINLSTPGLDRVLKDRKELDIFEGRVVRFVYMENGEKITKTGILRGNSNDSVLFEVDSNIISLPFSSIVKVELYEKLFEKRKGGKK